MGRAGATQRGPAGLDRQPRQQRGGCRGQDPGPDDPDPMLKSSSSESMMIRTARRYDPATGSIVYSNNDTFDNSAYDNVGLRNDQLFQFCILQEGCKTQLG